MQIAFCRNNKPSVGFPPDPTRFCLVKGFVFRSAAYENAVQGCFLSRHDGCTLVLISLGGQLAGPSCGC